MEIENSPASIIFVDNGQMVGPVRIYNKDKIFAILSDIPIDYDNAIDFTESVIDFSKKIIFCLDRVLVRHSCSGT
jgi:uncharacterized protein